MPVVLDNWRDFFVHWPPEMPRRGIVITAFGEQIPFSAFWTSSNFLLLERQNPDSIGARTIVLEFAQIAGLKTADIIKIKTFQTIGFEGQAAKS
jgi:hypothetical protein